MGSLLLAAMGYRLLLQSSALIYFTLLSVHSQLGPVGDQATEDCCPSITVSGLETNQDLNGEYILKTKLNSKPDEVCLNGCIYMKKDDKDEFCFRKDEDSLISSECFVVLSTTTTITTTTTAEAAAATTAKALTRAEEATITTTTKATTTTTTTTTTTITTTTITTTTITTMTT